MKVLALLISFYIVVLMVFPCDDAAHLKNEYSVTVSSGSQHDHQDSCSPFCICQCCHALYHMTLSPEFTFSQDLNENLTPYFISDYPAVPNEFLIPPENQHSRT